MAFQAKVIEYRPTYKSKLEMYHLIQTIITSVSGYDKMSWDLVLSKILFSSLSEKLPLRSYATYATLRCKKSISHDKDTLQNAATSETLSQRLEFETQCRPPTSAWRILRQKGMLAIKRSVGVTRGGE